MFSSHQTLLVYIVWRTPATQTQLFPCTSTAHPSPSARDSRRGQDRHTIVKSPSTREMGRRCLRVTNITPESVYCGVPCITKVFTAILCTVIYMSFLCSTTVCSMFCITALSHLDKCYTANTDNNLWLYTVYCRCRLERNRQYGTDESMYVCTRENYGYVGTVWSSPSVPDDSPLLWTILL